MKIKFAIGTTNPVKIESVKEALIKVYKDNKKFEIFFNNSDSEISSLPKSDKECIVGARNRSLNILKIFPDVDYGVGIEGGLDINDNGVFLITWIVIINKYKEEGIGCGPKICLPKKAANLVFKDNKLTDIMQLYINDKNIKTNIGADGILSNNFVDRKESTKIAFLCAFSKFINTKCYKE
jgi:inosine/xanthosine triphosphatase